MTLTEFLVARLAEDASQAGLDAMPAETDWAACNRAQREVLTKYGLLAVLTADLESPAGSNPKGTLAERIGYAYGEGARVLAEHALEVLTLPYADHPEYDEEWKP